MPSAARAKSAVVTFPARGTPPDEHGYPHYDRLKKANAAYRASYEKVLKLRRALRQQYISSPQNKTPWERRKKAVCSSFAAALGLTRVQKPVAPAFRFDRSAFIGRSASVIPETALSLNFRWLKLSGASWDNGEFELLVVQSYDVPGPHPAVLLIPDSGVGFVGAESPEGAVRGWGERLVAAGYMIGIPRLPSLERLSSTHNKKRIVEGASALGEIAFESAQALGALLKQAGVEGKRAWVAGAGLGALTAIFLGALDGRVAGVLADSPASWGNIDDPHALLVGGSHVITDLPELAAMIAPKPLVLIDAANDAGRAKLASTRTLKTAAEPAYRSQQAAGNIAMFSPTQTAQAPAWMRTRDAATKLPVSSGVVKNEAPLRRFATWRFNSARDWQKAAKELRREYPRAIGIPEIAQPLKVVEMSRVRLPNYDRTEYHIQTGEHTWANTILMQPRGFSGASPTILYLPGSGSDVAKQEQTFAHEVIALGWNACVIDARAALYPFHPGIAEGRAILPQGLHDLRCCTNWLFEQPCVDVKRVATMGVSQGGTHSWMLTAVEPRIAATAPVCGICTYASLDQYVTEWYGGADHSYRSFFDSHSIYYYPPALLRLAEQQDVCALIAPRPFMFIGGSHDDCFPVDGMREASRDIRHVYKLLGAEKNFVYYEFDGPHSMPEHSRKAAYAFFKRAFR